MQYLIEKVLSTSKALPICASRYTIYSWVRHINRIDLFRKNVDSIVVAILCYAITFQSLIYYLPAISFIIRGTSVLQLTPITAWVGAMIKICQNIIYIDFKSLAIIYAYSRRYRVQKSLNLLINICRASVFWKLYNLYQAYFYLHLIYMKLCITTGLKRYYENSARWPNLKIIFVTESWRYLV